MKFFKTVLSIVLITLLVGCGNNNKETLYVLNWGEYMDPDLVDQFEKEYDVKVVYDVVDSNEAMYSKIISNTTNYDVAIPSDYMIEKLSSEGLINNWDTSKLNISGNVDEKLYELTQFDNDTELYVPYFYGSVGIIYNKDLVDEEDLGSWDILWNEKYDGQILMYDSIREMITAGAKYNGFSINTTDEDELKTIEESLKVQNKLNSGYGTDDIKNAVASGNAALGLVYNGDYLVIEDEYAEAGDESNVGYFIPKEGTNVWVDGFVNPTTSKNPELAHDFINFMLDKEHAKQNAEWVGYSTTHPEVYADFLEEDEEYYSSEAYKVPENLIENSEVYYDLGEEYYQIYSDIFTRVKNSN